MLTALARWLGRKLFPPREVIEGYEHDQLVETVFQKTKAYQPQGEWPLVAGASAVLDFGGGCGVHYELARLQSPEIRWAVVETPAMARRASALATDHLRFFTDVAEAATWLGAIDIMHSNGALQYTPDPLAVLDVLCGLKAKQMYWQRVPFSDGGLAREIQSSFLGDNGPGGLPVGQERIVKYALTKIPEERFLEAHRAYDTVERGSDWFHFRLRQLQK
jgi:putative methyltransferase (TIGR04325 family)